MSETIEEMLELARLQNVKVKLHKFKWQIISDSKPDIKEVKVKIKIKAG